MLSNFEDAASGLVSDIVLDILHCKRWMDMKSLGRCMAKKGGTSYSMSEVHVQTFEGQAREDKLLPM